MNHWKTIPAGVIQQDELLAILQGAIMMRPDYEPALDAVAQMANVGSYWQAWKLQQMEGVTVLNVPQKMLSE